MGLKGYRLWAMGQLDSNVQSPAAVRPREVADPSRLGGRVCRAHVPRLGVAPQVLYLKGEL
jgi:hypothetical protein